MPDIMTTPVELGFTEFVAKLISDTFEAVLTSSVKQEEDWMQMYDLVSLGLEEYARKVISEELLMEEMKKLFPDGQGGTAIIPGQEYLKGDPSNGISESPPVYLVTGFQPTGKKLQQKEVDRVFELVRQTMASRQYEILKRLFAVGTTKVVVDSGKINAKLTFNVSQVDEAAPAAKESPVRPRGGNAGPRELIPEIGIKKIILENKPASFLGITRPTELQKVHFFVRPPSDKQPETSTVSANVYSEVEIHFKMVT